MSDVEEVGGQGTRLLEEAVQAAHRGDDGIARSLLLHASGIESTLDSIWLWLAHLSSSLADRERYLRIVLANHPGHFVAIAMLADTLCEEGIAAAKAGARDRAKALLIGAIEIDRSKESAWLWLAAVEETKEQKRHDLSEVLALDPHHR